MKDINSLILAEIKSLGIDTFAQNWGFTPNAVKMVQRTKKPSAAMLTKAFEMMTASAEEETPQPAPRRQPRAPIPARTERGPVPQPFRRSPGTAPMFTKPDGMDVSASGVRPASAVPPPEGAPFVVPPGSRPGFVPARHAGIALGQMGLHGQQEQGVVVPAGIDPKIWMMFVQFMQMMGMAPQPQEIGLPGGNLEMPDDYGHGWNVPHGYKLVPVDDEEETGAERPRRRKTKMVKK